MAITLHAPHRVPPRLKPTAKPAARSQVSKVGQSSPLPHCQIHVIDPFMNRSAGGILVQLVLDADHIRPRGIVDRPGLVESVGLTIDDQRVVAILRGADALNVPLDVVPGIRRPARASDSIEDPTIARTIPGRPVAVAKV